MKAKYNFTITGFLLALILISMFAGVFASFMTNMNAEYGLVGENSFEKYDATEEIMANTKDVRDATDISQDTGFIDIIGAYFTSGYAALKTSIASIELVDDMFNDATSDVDIVGVVDFMSYIYMIIIIALFSGVIIAILVKMRI